MRVSVIGTGYVGLVSGVCLAAKGHEVVCVDLDQGKVDDINRGVSPIYEEGLTELLHAHIGTSLRATTDLLGAVTSTEVSLIAVGTPFDGSEIDLRQVEEAARQIGVALGRKRSYHAVVVKSTVVPGTTDQVVGPIIEETSGATVGLDFGLGMNPEFLREGKAIEDFMNPDRIVLGGVDERTLEVLEALYEPFEGVDVLRTNNKTAEMIKYTSNSLLATMISFSNEIANLCSDIEGVDVRDVLTGVHLDKRLSPILPSGQRIVPSFTTYLEAGCGFGGSCFPKDVQALVAHGRKNGRAMPLLGAVLSINEGQPAEMLSLLARHFESLDGVPLAVLGLAFKPGTDDMRESPAIPIVKHLLAEGATVRAYDPVASENAEKLFGNDRITYCGSMAEAVEGVEAILLLTRWDEFEGIPSLLDGRASQPLLVDGRRMIEKREVTRYEGIGL